MTEVNNQKLAVAERIALLEECNKLIGSTRTRRSLAPVRAELPIDRDELNAAIMGTGIAGFDASMSKRSKRIVKNTYMYADLVALLKYPGKSQREQRYDEFVKLMKLSGWFVFSAPYNKYQSSSQKLTMDNLALGILHTAVTAAVSQGQAALKVLSTVADSTMAALKDEPEALKLFENNSKKAEGGNFCMSTALEGADGDITMAIAAVQYFAAAQPTKVLFVEWNTSSVEIYNSSAHMHMDEEDYLLVEPLIVAALAANRQKALTYEFGKA